MNLEIKKDKRLINKIGNSLNMTEEEKKISFLNNYFIFKKIRNINIENDLFIKNKKKFDTTNILDKFDTIQKDIPQSNTQEDTSNTQKDTSKHIPPTSSSKTTVSTVKSKSTQNISDKEREIQKRIDASKMK